MRRSRILLLLCVVATLTAGSLPSGAALGSIAPPFRDKFEGGFCSTPTIGGCGVVATADVETGAALSSVSVSTLQDGTLPGLGEGYSNASLLARHRLRREARALTYTVTVHVNQADASVDTLTEGSSVDFANAYAFVSAFAYHDDCFGCFGGIGVDIVDARGGSAPPSRAGEDIVLTLVMRNFDGEKIPPGRINVGVDVVGYAGLGYFFVPTPNVGTAGASVDAVVTDVFVQRGAPPPEPVPEG